MKKRFWFGLSGVLFWAMASDAQAYECKLVTVATTLPAPDLIVQRDQPVGSAIGNELVSGVVSVYNCTNEPAPALIAQTFGVKAEGTYAMMLSGRRIYSTNIAGIGYAVGVTSVSNCNNAYTYYVDGTNDMGGNKNTKGVCGAGGILTFQPITAQANIQFYKTAQTTGTGNLAVGKAGAFILYNQGTTFEPESAINIPAFNVKSVACSVQNTAIVVPMGTVEKRAFKGPGTWPGDANTRFFQITLNCDSTTNIFFRIDGSAQNASQGILNLSAANDGASGVGIQLLYKDVPLPLSTETYLGVANTPGSRDYIVPLKARYYQTGSNITTGTAKASATFTIIYRQ